MAYKLLFNAAAAPGIGAVTCGTAISGYRNPVSASLPDGTQITYTIFSSDRTQWESGAGTYHSGANTISRDTPSSGSAPLPVNFTLTPLVWAGGDSGLSGLTWLDFLPV